MNKKELKQIILKFHDSIVLNQNFKIKGNYGEDINDFKYFPQNCCDRASELLKIFLKEEYNLVFKIIQTSKDHVFIENKNYIIDITAYQFNINGSNYDKIIVENNKENYYYYKFRQNNYITSEIYTTDKYYIEFYKIIVNDFKQITRNNYF